MASQQPMTASPDLQSQPALAVPLLKQLPPDLQIIPYNTAHSRHYLPQIRHLIAQDLSEPYSIYVYRYFLLQWPDLCFLVVRRDAVASATRTDDAQVAPGRQSDPADALNSERASSTSSTSPESASLVGVVISKLEPHVRQPHSFDPHLAYRRPSADQQEGFEPPEPPLRGYIAMLAVSKAYRHLGLATRLVTMSIDAMKRQGAAEIVLETEISNTASLKLYERLGFLRSKRLFRYYLNGGEAFRLVLLC